MFESICDVLQKKPTGTYLTQTILRLTVMKRRDVIVYGYKQVEVLRLYDSTSYIFRPCF